MLTNTNIQLQNEDLELRIVTNFPMSEDFFFRGYNPKGPTPNDAYFKGLALICGQESLKVLEPNNKVFDILLTSTLTV